MVVFSERRCVSVEQPVAVDQLNRAEVECQSANALNDLEAGISCQQFKTYL